MHGCLLFAVRVLCCILPLIRPTRFREACHNTLLCVISLFSDSYSGRCVFSWQPHKLVPQTTLTVLGDRLGWLFASLPTVSTPIPLSIRSAGILILAHLLANMTPIRKVRRLPHGTCQLAAEGRRRCRGLSVELSPHSCVNGPCQISMQIPMSFLPAAAQ